MEKYWEKGYDVANMSSILASNLLKKRRETRWRSYNIEDIPRIKERGGLTVDVSICEEDRWCEVCFPNRIFKRVNRFVLQKDKLIYTISEFAWEAEEAGR